MFDSWLTWAFNFDSSSGTSRTLSITTPTDTCAFAAYLLVIATTRTFEPAISFFTFSNLYGITAKRIRGYTPAGTSSYFTRTILSVKFFAEKISSIVIVPKIMSTNWPISSIDLYFRFTAINKSHWKSSCINEYEIIMKDAIWFTYITSDWFGNVHKWYPTFFQPFLTYLRSFVLYAGSVARSAVDWRTQGIQGCNIQILLKLFCTMLFHSLHL